MVLLARAAAEPVEPAVSWKGARMSTIDGWLEGFLHDALIHRSPWKRGSANFSCTEFSEVQIRSRTNMIAVKVVAPTMAHSSRQVVLSSASRGSCQPPRRRCHIYPDLLASFGGAPDEHRTC